MTPAVIAAHWQADHLPGSVVILPDGSLDIIWTGERIMIAGPDTVPHLVDLSRAQTMSGIRLRPGLGAAVIGHDASALRDLRVDGDDLWPAEE
ncbi:MAG: AraC family transcriptional regulator, partial [Gordonia sp. (in: high G+C Gram-positive bacteria)]